MRFEQLDDTASKLFAAYDGFLGMLSDQTVRKHLEDLPPDPDRSDGVFKKAHELSHTFRDGLLELFFNESTELFQLTKIYGVF